MSDDDINVFYLQAEEFERLLERLDEPPRDNPRLRELLVNRVRALETWDE